ncbi:MAG TPA: HAD-IIIA family hydrolase [Solirubrobacteraceae bacterium]|nr:HAD-IIIA family hydrolase [Solirubrobacteraceae bacterium]
MPTAIVTGSGGLVGSESVAHFVRAGYEVVGFENDMRARLFGPDASVAHTTARLLDRYRVEAVGRLHAAWAVVRETLLTMSWSWREAWEHGPLAYDPPEPSRPREGLALDRPAADRPAVFLDRDGVINAGVPDPHTGLLESPLRPSEVRLLPGVPEALRELARAGLLLVCVSNQPAAAKGKTSLDELVAVHERVLELLAEQDVALDASRLCPHHPEAVVVALSGLCRCRKPAPGMLLDAARSLGVELTGSWMVGDTDTDVAAGAAAGCRTVLVEYPGSAHKRSDRSHPDHLAESLPAAVSRLR